MAQRRMFSKHVTDSDAFLDMPASTQALYFHLNMAADDDGFVNAPNRIVRTVGGSADDLKLLIVKRFILTFDSGIIVIKHWRLHNYIQNDRRKSTVYHEERAMLEVDKNGSYTEKCVDGYRLDTDCIQGIDTLDTQDRLGKDSIGEVSIGKDSIDIAANARAREEEAHADGKHAAAAAKQNDLKELVRAFEDEICKISPIVAQDLEERYKQIGKDLLLECISEAGRNKGGSWKYVDKIAQRCVDTNIKTVEEFNDRKKAHQAKRQPSSSGHKAGEWQPDRPGSKYADIYKN